MIKQQREEKQKIAGPGPNDLFKSSLTAPSGRRGVSTLGHVRMISDKAEDPNGISLSSLFPLDLIIGTKLGAASFTSQISLAHRGSGPYGHERLDRSCVLLHHGG